MATHFNGPIVHFQDEKYFQPVKCSHIECLDQGGTKESCPLHSNYYMPINITEIMDKAAVKVSNDRERAKRMGWKEGGGKSKGQKVKDVLSAILYAV